MRGNDRPREEALLEHIYGLLQAPAPPELPPGAENNEQLRKIHEYLVNLRTILTAFSRGDMSPTITLRGFVGGNLKALQANLLHLTWQIQQVAEGDFSQRVDFLGSFSDSFNEMVVQLNSAITALRQKEEELTHLTLALQNEIEQKANALSALRKSEASFRYMAEHDALTGVCNRRSFYDLAVMELQRSYEARQPCVLGMLDIDYFKRFNDTYGHLEGDAALRHVTQTIQAGLRDQDILGRYGGEEFVLLLPGTDRDGGIRSAERHRLDIMQSPIKTHVGSASITISMGLVYVSPDDTPVRNVAFLEKLLGFADEALYTAKNGGRNRLEISSYPDICLIPNTAAD